MADERTLVSEGSAASLGTRTGWWRARIKPKKRAAQRGQRGTVGLMQWLVLFVR